MEKQNRTYLAEYAGIQRSIVSGKTNEEVKRWALERYQNIVSSDVNPEFNFTGLQNIQDNFGITSTVAYKPFLDTKDNLSYVEYDYWLRDEIDSMYIKNKHYRTKVSGTRVSSEYLLDVSTLWKLTGAIPKLALKHKYGELVRSYTLLPNNTIRVNTSLQIPSQIIQADEREKFNKFLGLLKRESTIKISAILSE